MSLDSYNHRDVTSELHAALEAFYKLFPNAPKGIVVKRMRKQAAGKHCSPMQLAYVKADGTITFVINADAYFVRHMSGTARQQFFTDAITACYGMFCDGQARAVGTTLTY